MFKRKVKLPQTLAEFDTLVEKVCKRYKLQDSNHAAAIISVAIRHIPNDKSYTTLEYLGQTVQKNIANHIADHKSQMLRHGAEIEMLLSKIKENPLDQQSRDALQKAANDGSEAALNAIASLEVVSLVN